MRTEPLHSRFTTLPFIGVLAFTLIPTICFNILAFKCVVGNEMELQTPRSLISQQQPTLLVDNQQEWTPNDENSPVAIEAISDHKSRTTFKVLTTMQNDVTAVETPENGIKAQRRPNSIRPFNFDVYANPLNHNVLMQCTALNELGVRIAVTDLLGKEIMSGIRHFLKGDNELEFDVSHLAHGQYFVSMENMENEEHILTKRLNVTATHRP